MPREFEMATYQFEQDALSYRAIKYSVACEKATEEWREIFEEHAKEGGSFSNNVGFSMYFSQDWIGTC